MTGSRSRYSISAIHFTSTRLVIGTIISYFRNSNDISYISGINDTIPGVILISSNLDSD